MKTVFDRNSKVETCLEKTQLDIEFKVKEQNNELEAKLKTKVEDMKTEIMKVLNRIEHNQGCK